jgi:hypothetical protein
VVTAGFRAPQLWWYGQATAALRCGAPAFANAGRPGNLIGNLEAPIRRWERWPKS